MLTGAITWSDEFKRLYGFKPEDGPDRPAIVGRIVPEDQQRIDAAVKATVNGGAPYDVEYRIIWPDGSIRWLSSRGRLHRNGDGTPVDMQGVIMDITERKQIEELKAHQAAERRRAEALARSNEELQQFAYIAAHDLQEPLRMVASYTQLLGQRYKGRLDSDADEFIDFAVDGARRMQMLISDLLAYCRVETAGKVPVEVSSHEAFEEAVRNLEGTVAENDARIVCDQLPLVMADRTQLVQLFQNLVGNAIKYRTPKRPEIRVSASRGAPNEWIFSISDNGIGIDPKYSEKIFLMFQRLHSREEFSGTGIGLTLCKKIAERHGGRIWVEPNTGPGSTFHVALPERVMQ
jgi:PAS domain S-box-containing protein